LHFHSFKIQQLLGAANGLPAKKLNNVFLIIAAIGTNTAHYLINSVFTLWLQELRADAGQRMNDQRAVRRVHLWQFCASHTSTFCAICVICL
jgi:hypothetical protein